jgi:hypothetical protein
MAIMFAHLFEYGFQRTGMQALGFYIAHLILLILLAGMIGGFTALGYGANGFEEGKMIGERTGTIVAVIASMTLSFVVIWKKHLWRPVPIAFALLSGLLGFVGGGILGLIPVACITTIPWGEMPTLHRNG